MNRIYKKITAVSFLILVNIFTFFVARHFENEIVKSETISQLTSAILNIEDNLRENSLALQRMGDRWGANNGTSELAWRKDAIAYSHDLIGVVGTGYADAEGKIQWIEPEEKNRAAIGFVLKSEESRLDAIKEAERTKRPQMTRPIDLKQNGLGHLIIYPVFVKEKLDGYVYLVGRYSEYFPKILRNQDFIFRIYSGTKLIYKSRPDIPVESEDFKAQSSHINFTNNFKIEVFPTLPKIKSVHGRITLWAMLGASILSFMFLVSLNLLERSRILARKKIEQEAWKDAILNGTELAVISTDINGLVVSFNSAAEKLLGYKQEEVVGLHTPALWHDMQEIANRAVALSEEYNTEIEPGFDVLVYKAKRNIFDRNVWTYITKMGIRKKVLLTAHPLKDDASEIIGFVGVIEELTDKYKLKEQILEKEKSIDKLIENTFDGFWDWNIKNDFQYMSPRFWQMFGYDPSEMKHHPSEWRSKISKEGLDLADENFKKHVETKGEHPYYQEVCYKHKDGHDVWVICKGKVIEWAEDGSPVRMVGTHTDITELKKKNEKIEAARKELIARDAKILELKSRNEDWFRVITSSLPQLMWTCTPEGPCDYLSEQWVKYTGISEKDQLGYGWLNQIHPEDKDRVVEKWSEKVTTQKTFVIKFRIRRYDGVYHWFDTMAIPIKDESGEVVRWLGSNSDIQELYAIKENLEESKTQLQNAQELAKIGSWELVLENGETSWSKQMFAIFEMPFTENKIELKIIKEKYLQSLPNELKQKVVLCRTKGVPYSGLFSINISTGLKWINVRGEPVYNDGKITKLRGTCQDVTEEVNSTKELNEVKTRLVVALEGANIGIWEWDISSNFLSWDKQMFTIYGKKRGDFKNAYEDWKNSVHPDDFEKVSIDLEYALKTNSDFNSEFRIIAEDGTVRYVYGRAKVIADENKKPIKMIGINWDITKIKLNELDLKRTRAEALQSSVAKAQFLANMSHEIRTPLNGIIGMSNLLGGTSLDDQQREYLEHVIQSSSMLLALVNDILDLSKIESGNIELEHIDFNLEQTLDYIISSLSYTAKNKGIELTMSSDLPDHLWLKGDPSRLKQVLLNLTSNAIKFTNEGSVKIQTKVISKKDSSLKIRIEVTDTGIGISESQQEKLFQNFSQADASTQRKFGGTGLGLAISKLLVEKMKGNIGIISKLGEGSTFWIEIDFSLGVEGVNHTNEEHLDNKEAKNIKILVAEDNIINQKVAKATLAKMGYECQIVGNGIEAIQILQNISFDLILMDCQMPEMDGLEATAEIRKSNSAFSDIPIVAMTANAMKEDRERCLMAGMNDYITKPIIFSELSKVIEKWIKYKNLKS